MHGDGGVNSIFVRALLILYNICMIQRSQIVEFTGALPVGARQHIKAVFLEGRDAARQGDLATRDSRVRTLGRFAMGHGLQIIGGLFFGAVNAYNAVRSGSDVSAAQAVYDGLYATVNAAVTYTQAHLASSLRAMPVAAAPMPPVEAGATPSYGRRCTATERATVVAGQLAFMATIAGANIGLAQDLQVL